MGKRIPMTLSASFAGCRSAIRPIAVGGRNMSVDASSPALTLQWVDGFNSRGGASVVHNLADGARRAIFFSAANTGVIYSVASGTQMLLQGHVRNVFLAFFQKSFLFRPRPSRAAA